MDSGNIADNPLVDELAGDFYSLLFSDFESQPKQIQTQKRQNQLVNFDAPYYDRYNSNFLQTDHLGRAIIPRAGRLIQEVSQLSFHNIWPTQCQELLTSDVSSNFHLIPSLSTTTTTTTRRGKRKSASTDSSPTKKQKTPMTEKNYNILQKYKLFNRDYDNGNPLFTVHNDFFQLYEFVEISENAFFFAHKFKKTRAIKTFTGSHYTALEGSYLIQNVHYKSSFDLQQILNKINTNPSFCFIKLWEENTELKTSLVSNLDWIWLDSFCYSSGNLLGLYASRSVLSHNPILSSLSLPIPPRHLVNFWRLPQTFILPAILFQQISALDQHWTSHYSSANVDKKSWTAITVRGYSTNHKDCWKPEEMSVKWRKERNFQKGESYESLLTDTTIKVYLSGLNEIVRWFEDRFEKRNVHRIRLLRLEAGGRIGRHCDLPIKTDRGEMCRFHVAIETNEDVWMSSWSLRGREVRVRMGVGEVWRIDNRKPHAVTNEGSRGRIHLVVDVVDSDGRVAALLAEGNVEKYGEDWEKNCRIVPLQQPCGSQ
eukprot:TRINITY_DN2010_c0_g1_i1.p1 TRINITY_DN2010_c0_g1~~TRINITY_DN2010_c0_g1_i1.p1  ORF type:complete len:551 (-),score=119.01 TRINITY_DN2010_c0_g1_i1:16-1635(-)